MWRYLSQQAYIKEWRKCSLWDSLSIRFWKKGWIITKVSTIFVYYILSMMNQFHLTFTLFVILNSVSSTPTTTKPILQEDAEVQTIPTPTGQEDQVTTKRVELHGRTTASIYLSSTPDTSQMIAILSATSQLQWPMRCWTFITSPPPGCRVKMLDHCQRSQSLSGCLHMSAIVFLQYPD